MMSSFSSYSLRDSAAIRLLVLFTLFFFFLLLAGGMGAALGMIPGLGERTVILLSSAVQGLVAFVLPAWLTARFASPLPSKFFGLAGAINWRPFAGVLIVYCLALPAMNQLILWNESIHFPEWASGLETTLREWEEANGKVAEILLSGTTVWNMLVTVTVVGLITGFSEELFFRGTLQNIFTQGGAKKWISVWGAAIIFSTMHFQFFGFVPRLLMGAFFGYLFIWSGSLWPSVFAHMLNNSLVVVGSWIAERNETVNIDNLGVATDGALPLAALSSVIATTLFLWGFRSYFFKSIKR